VKQLALCLLLLNPLSASAQFTDVMGSRANGMGGSALLETNAWASFNNPAALAMDTGNQIAGNYANSYLLPEIGTSALAAKFSSGTRAFGIGLSSFGYSEFRSNTLQASYAMKLDEHFSMGVNLGLRYLQLGDIYGQSFSPTASLGMMIYINEELSFAALLKDPFNFKIDEAAIDRYPVLLRSGLRYQFSDDIFTNLELEKALDKDLRIRGGFQYAHPNGFSFRLGLITQPFEYSLGAGYLKNRFGVDLSYSYHPLLGFSPQLGFLWNWGS
jgi:hypothetical protein